jgi:hypothetical protein
MLDDSHNSRYARPETFEGKQSAHPSAIQPQPLEDESRPALAAPTLAGISDCAAQALAKDQLVIDCRMCRERDAPAVSDLDHLVVLLARSARRHLINQASSVDSVESVRRQQQKQNSLGIF